MQPEPLLWRLADDALQRGGHPGGVVPEVSLPVAGARHLERPLDPEPEPAVLAQRHHDERRRPGSHRGHGERGSCRHGTPEEGNEERVLSPDGLVHQHRHHLVPSERRHHSGQRAARGDEPQARPLARLDQPGVDSSAERPHHRVEWHPLRHRRAEQLPGPEMRRGDQQTPAPGERSLHRSEVVHLHLFQELSAARPERAQRVHHHPRHVGVGGAGEHPALLLGALGEGVGEVVQRDAPADPQGVGAGGHRTGETVDESGRERLEETHQHPRGRPGKDSRLDERRPLHHVAC